MYQKGIVFDIQRFSLHDGPGIRTTVFLKGCPLRCIWCHNPESWHKQPQLVYKKDKCRSCFKCVSVCRSGAHGSEHQIHFLDRSKCQSSFRCAGECAFGALKVSGFETDTRAVIEVVEKDYRYFLNSGGGLTISGGEPMLQFEFTLDLLKCARRENIHTCIETCGFDKKENYEKIMEYTDLFLFDFKATGSKKHKELTGVKNEGILENLDFLYSHGAAIILRCPLIPGINDTEQHLEGIAALSVEYPELQAIELLPYHDMGRSKWEEVGYPYKLGGLKTSDDTVKANWLKKLKNIGCDKAVLS